jgi:hypothetical protein
VIGVEAYESNDSPEAGEVEEVNDTGETRDTARDTTGVADTQAVENTESNPAGITENRYEALRKALSRLSSTTLRQRNAYRNDYLSAIGEWEAALETKLLTESPGTAVR